jgi:hypothetical protein
MNRKFGKTIALQRDYLEALDFEERKTPGRKKSRFFCAYKMIFLHVIFFS